jgi:uroporphyrinogen-III synthase
VSASLGLAGRRILVTRPAEDAEGLAARLREAGGTALCVPTLEIQPLADLSALHAVASQLEAYRFAIFVSRNAVRFGIAALQAQRGAKPWPVGLRLASVGAGTRRALEEQGFTSVLAPTAPADSEALLALPELQSVAGLRIALFRGEGGRTLLADTLAARGAIVAQAACYRRARPDHASKLYAAWAAAPVDAVAVSSAEGLANLAALLGGGAAERLRASVLFVPHARVALAAERLGLNNVQVAGPGDREMAAAMVAYFTSAS